MSLYYTVRRLEVLQGKVGGSSKKKSEDDGVDTSKMTPYEKGQYECARHMQGIRHDIDQLNNLDAGASAARKAQLSQALRKQVTALKKECASVKTAAKNENRKDEFEQLVGHVNKTEKLYKSRFMKEDDRDDDDGADAGGGGGGRRGVRQVQDIEMDSHVQGASLAEDEEFQQFFEQTKHNDVKMDQALDRISSGVQRLQTNATTIKDELSLQKHLLDETEEKVDKVHVKLVGVNKKLKDTIKKLDQDKVCIYAICIILLLGIAGMVYHFSKSK